MAAWKLSRDHDITVFEADNRIGGHTHTVDVSLGGRDWAVDTGFIVFNDWTYPNFIEMLETRDFFGVPGVFTAPWWPIKLTIFLGAALCAVLFALRTLRPAGSDTTIDQNTQSGNPA